MKRSRVVLVLLLVLAFFAGGTTVFAATGDPCNQLFSSGTIAKLKSYDECRFDRIEAKVDALKGPVGPTSAPSPTSPAPSPTSSPKPTPTLSATPSPTATPVTFPDASNTGIPAGATLTNRAGDQTFSAAGSWSNLNITGTVQINASNVILKNVRISGSGYAVVRVKSGVTGVRIEDSEIDGRGTAGTANSGGVNGPATIVRTEIKGVENAVVPESGSEIVDSWIHGLGAPGSPHVDGFQLDGGQSNVRIIHNTIDMREWSQTATVMIDNYFGPINTVTVDRNRLLGGGYTVYSDGQFTGGTINGVMFSNNRLGKGQWGYSLIRGNASGPTWTGNVDDATGAAIPR